MAFEAAEIDIPRTAPAQPRAHGSVAIAAAARGPRGTALADLAQAGAARALFPRTGTADLQGVLINTAGGVTGGDRLRWSAEARAGARLTLTTQAAERAYRAQPDETARIETRLSAGPGAALHWLPQETILFDHARLERRLEADLAGGARLLAVEPIIFGRTAMGERLAALHFAEQWRIRREGRLVYADALRLSGPAEAVLARPATLAGHRAMASLVLADPEAEAALAPLRAQLSKAGSAAGALGGASLLAPDLLAARIVAPDGRALRRVLIPALAGLTGGPLPKVWSL